MAVEGVIPTGRLLWAPLGVFGSSASVDEVRPTNIKPFRALVEYPELEGTLKDHPGQLVALHRHPSSATLCLRALSKRS